MKIEKLVKKAKGLRLRVQGLANVKWTEGGGRSSVTYQGEQVFLSATNYFFGKEGAEPIEVSSGVHLYKFSCRVPKDAPGSAEGKHGYIRYKVDINLDIPYLPDLSSVQPFIVVRHEDLNRYPELRIPNEIEEVKSFCCFICESDPILMKISTSQSGYVCGDTIKVKIELFNRSNVNFSHSMITLNRVETCYSYTPLEKTKKHATPITSAKSKGVDARRNASFEESIYVPHQVSVSNDRICDVFQISYEIVVSVKAAKKSSVIEAKVPIYVGTVGFRLNSNVSLTSSCLPMDDLRKFRFYIKASTTDLNVSH